MVGVRVRVRGGQHRVGCLYQELDVSGTAGCDGHCRMGAAVLAMCSSTGAWPHLVALPGTGPRDGCRRWELGVQSSVLCGALRFPGGTPARGVGMAEGCRAEGASAGRCCWRGDGPGPSAPYLTWGEARSRAASLRSRASTAPPSRCRHTNCGSLSTLRISSWCLSMRAAASCREAALSGGCRTGSSGCVIRDGDGHSPGTCIPAALSVLRSSWMQLCSSSDARPRLAVKGCSLCREAQG